MNLHLRYIPLNRSRIHNPSVHSNRWEKLARVSSNCLPPLICLYNLSIHFTQSPFVHEFTHYPKPSVILLLFGLLNRAYCLAVILKLTFIAFPSWDHNFLDSILTFDVITIFFCWSTCSNKFLREGPQKVNFLSTLSPKNSFIVTTYLLDSMLRGRILEKSIFSKDLWAFIH